MTETQERFPVGPTIDISKDGITRTVGIEKGMEVKVCEFHETHKVHIYDTYFLQIKEKRAVVDTSCRWANKEPTLNLGGPFGYRAIDRKGDWWRNDWYYGDYTDYYRTESWIREFDNEFGRLEKYLFKPYVIRNTL